MSSVCVATRSGHLHRAGIQFSELAIMHSLHNISNDKAGVASNNSVCVLAGYMDAGKWNGDCRAGGHDKETAKNGREKHGDNEGV